MKNNKFYYIFGTVLVLIAVAFVIFAFSHPEMSFSWPNFVSYIIYGCYAAYTVTVFLMPKFKNPRKVTCLILAMLFGAVIMLVMSMFAEKGSVNRFYLIYALFLVNCANILNIAVLKNNKRKEKEE